MKVNGVGKEKKACVMATEWGESLVGRRKQAGLLGGENRTSCRLWSRRQSLRCEMAPSFGLILMPEPIHIL